MFIGMAITIKGVPVDVSIDPIDPEYLKIDETDFLFVDNEDTLLEL